MSETTSFTCPEYRTRLKRVVRITRDSQGTVLKIVKYVCQKCGYWRFRD